MVEHQPERPAAAAANHHRGAEHAAGAAAADGQAGGENLAQRDGQQQGRTGAGVLGHGLLQGGIPEGEDRQHILLPAQQEVQRQTHQSGQEQRRGPAGNGGGGADD